MSMTKKMKALDSQSCRSHAEHRAHRWYGNVTPGADPEYLACPGLTGADVLAAARRRIADRVATGNLRRSIIEELTDDANAKVAAGTWTGPTDWRSA